MGCECGAEELVGADGKPAGAPPAGAGRAAAFEPPPAATVGTVTWGTELELTGAEDVGLDRSASDRESELPEEPHAVRSVVKAVAAATPTASLAMFTMPRFVKALSALIAPLLTVRRKAPITTVSESISDGHHVKVPDL